MITLVYICSSERAMSTLEEHMMIFLIGVSALVVVGIIVILLPYISLWRRQNRIAAAIRRREKTIKDEEIRRNRVRLLPTITEMYNKKIYTSLYEDIKIPSWYYDYLDGKLKV